jgi:EAL domain-containing protein (putative c-di-GMP-specific phosphodiesterase class I)
MLDSEGTLVSPFVFVPVAESIGLIHELGLRVLAVALHDVQTVSAAIGRQLTVSVNVSALQLDHDLHPTVEDAMALSGVDPHQVTLELTETVLAENQDAAGQYLSRLREMGCTVAMDDFGTGYSSLAYLASLPIDIIKVDRSFVMGLGQQESSMVLVRTVIQLARSLGMRTVAEGVETIEQAQILRALGADRGQGYLFSRPLSIAHLLALLESTGGVLASAEMSSASAPAAPPPAPSSSPGS